MSQIWCNSAKLMTALLGMGREGMISVWSSIWSVPLAGCSRDAPLYAGILPMASTHAHTDTPIPKSFLGPQALVLVPVSLNTDNQYLVKISVLWHFTPKWTPTDGLDAGPTGGVIVYRAVFISGNAVFQRKVGQPASNLENSEVTLWPFTRGTLLQFWLELGISF